MSDRSTLLAAGVPPRAAGNTARRLPLARAAAISYVAATGLGVMMRFDLVGFGIPIPFDHLLHSHSHTLYFGWAALGLLAAATPGLSRVTPVLHRAGIGAIGLTVLVYGGFLWTGYHPVTIAISTAMMLCWYVLAAAWWRRIPRDDRAAAVAYRYGLGYLVAASCGVWALAGVQASGGSAFAEELAIHAFLLGFGWFCVFAVVGAVLASRRRLGLSFDRAQLRPVLHGWGALAWVTFPLGVPGGPEVWGLGPLARTAGALLVIPGLLFVTHLWSAARGSNNRAVLRLAAVWFGVGVATTAFAAVGGSAALAVGGRQGVVIHLHAVFAGFVTPLLALVLAPRVSRALLFHNGFLALMLLGLGAAMFGQPRVGLEVAAGASIGLWLAGVGWAWPIGRTPPDSGVPRDESPSIHAGN